jgi:hypothetical protein
MVNQYQLNGELISDKHKFQAMNNKSPVERSKRRKKNMALQAIVQQSTKKLSKT